MTPERGYSWVARRCPLALVGASTRGACSPQKMVWDESRPEADVRKAIPKSKRMWIFLAKSDRQLCRRGWRERRGGWLLAVVKGGWRQQR